MVPFFRPDPFAACFIFVIALHHSISGHCLAPLRFKFFFFTLPVLLNDTWLRPASIFATVSDHRIYIFFPTLAGFSSTIRSRVYVATTIQAFTLFPAYSVRPFEHYLRSPGMCLFALLEPSPSDTFCYYICCFHYLLFTDTHYNSIYSHLVRPYIHGHNLSSSENFMPLGINGFRHG